MTSDVVDQPYRERLLPGPGLFGVLLLIIPAVWLVITPISSTGALPTAIIVYLIVTATMFLTSPAIRVENGTLSAGRAEISVRQLGEVETVGAEALREAIGPSLDARSYLVVRGWIHRGVKIENIDPVDPAPFWILTSRHPEKLAQAIRSAQR